MITLNIVFILLTSQLFGLVHASTANQRHFEELLSHNNFTTANIMQNSTQENAKIDVIITQKQSTVHVHPKHATIKVRSNEKPSPDISPKHVNTVAHSSSMKSMKGDNNFTGPTQKQSTSSSLKHPTVSTQKVLTSATTNQPDINVDSSNKSLTAQSFIMKKLLSQSKKGYVTYCPCYGGIAEQAWQLLRAMSYAKGLGRILVLPPFYEFRSNFTHRIVKLHKFKDFFNIDYAKRYGGLDFIDMEYFLKNVAPHVWPEQNRTIYCRHQYDGKCTLGYSANLYWQKLGIVFKDDDLIFDQFWGAEFSFHINFYLKKKYPPSKYKVLALNRAPGFDTEYSSKIEDWHRFLLFSRPIQDLGDKFQVANELRINTFLSTIILNRNMLHNLCKYTHSYQMNFFSAAQCLGQDKSWHLRERFLSYEMCNPSINTVVENITNVLMVRKELKKLLIISDYPDGYDHPDTHVQDVIAKLKTQRETRYLPVVTYYTYEDFTRWAHALYLIKLSGFFIGNCMDPYSSFGRRSVLNKLQDCYIFYANTSTVPKFDMSRYMFKRT